MACARPVVTELDALTGKKTEKTIALPSVFCAPIRSDLINIVHRDLNKNHHQAHGVNPRVGLMYSAESWGTGRAVARIPRVAGGGTHRSGQAAFGNMTRGGHMYSPKTTFRRIHRRVNLKLRRYAIVSAIAASAIPALVIARGHKIQNIPEIPLVLSHDSVAQIKKTKEAVKCLKAIGAYDDVERVIASRRVRAGKGKWRNRRHVQRRGPLVIYNDNKSGLTRAFRNIPGVDLCKVTRLNLLKLAPGAHCGRLIIWTSDAFEALDKIYGTYADAKPVKGKKGFLLPHACMTVTDIPRILHSEAVARVIRKKVTVEKRAPRRNPLRNYERRVELNPFAAELRRRAMEPAAKKSKKVTPERKAEMKKNRALRKAMIKALFA